MDIVSEPNPQRNQSRKWPLGTRISDESLKRLKDKSRKTRKYWGGFCKSTSIHGLQYLAQPRYKSSVDRIWWFMVVALGLLTACYHTWRQTVKWSQTTIDADNVDDELPLRELPFPAFTICDNRKLNFSLNEDEDSEGRNLIYLICGDDRIQRFNYSQENLFELIPPPIINCTLEWRQPGRSESSASSCDELMVRTLTDQGVCYTFNMLDPHQIYKKTVKHGHAYHGRSSDWNMEDGYRKGAPLFDMNQSNAVETGAFPKRGDNKVSLRLYHEKNVSPQFCYGDTDGYSLVLHNADEFPMLGHREHPWVPILRRTKSPYIKLPAFKKSLIEFKSRKIVPSENLAQYDAKQRKCYLPGEKPLAYFRKYTYTNCQLECVTNITKGVCRCIDFYMPRLQMPGESENITTVCTYQFDLMCALHFFGAWDQDREKCGCLPSCTTIEHEVHAYYSHRDSDLPKTEGKYEGLMVTEITLQTSVKHYIRSERRPVYTKVDFIADCGGVFGLFCGMSIISVIEFAYYWFMWLIGKDKEEDEKNIEMTDKSTEQSK